MPPRWGLFRSLCRDDGARIPQVARATETRVRVTERYYLSQCVKDETMAESIAAAFARQAGRPGAIVHFTGAFHTDFGTGTAERVRRRLPDRRVATISVLPVGDLNVITPSGEDLTRAAYLVYTVSPSAQTTPACRRSRRSSPRSLRTHARHVHRIDLVDGVRRCVSADRRLPTTERHRGDAAGLDRWPDVGAVTRSPDAIGLDALEQRHQISVTVARACSLPVNPIRSVWTRRRRTPSSARR